MCPALEVVGSTTPEPTAAAESSKKRKRPSSDGALDIADKAIRKKRRRRRVNRPPLENGKEPALVHVVVSVPNGAETPEADVKKKKKKKKKTEDENSTCRVEKDSSTSEGVAGKQPSETTGDVKNDKKLSNSAEDKKAKSSTTSACDPAFAPVEKKRRRKRSSKASGKDEVNCVPEEGDEKVPTVTKEVSRDQKKTSVVKASTPTEHADQRVGDESGPNATSDTLQRGTDGPSDPVSTRIGEDDTSAAPSGSESTPKHKDRKKKKKSSSGSKSLAPSKGRDEEKPESVSKTENEKSEEEEKEEQFRTESEAKLSLSEHLLNADKTLTKKERKKLRKSLKASKAATPSEADKSINGSEVETSKLSSPVAICREDEESKSSKAVETPTRAVTWADMKDSDEPNSVENKKKRRKSGGSQPGTPFKRVSEENVNYRDSRLMDNSFFSKDDTFGALAHKDLVVTRGKGFRKEKTKKKRLNHHGGVMNFQVNSFKFPQEDSD